RTTIPIIQDKIRTYSFASDRLPGAHTSTIAHQKTSSFLLRITGTLARMSSRSRTPAPAEPDYEIRIIGASHAPLLDFYHALLGLSWPVTLACIVGAYLGANAIFACIYLTVGGVEHARPDSFADAFFFSVQTMGTIGYGAMWPTSIGANV